MKLMSSKTKWLNALLKIGEYACATFYQNISEVFFDEKINICSIILYRLIAGLFTHKIVKLREFWSHDNISLYFIIR